MSACEKYFIQQCQDEASAEDSRKTDLKKK
jgi:hypothetical protein